MLVDIGLLYAFDESLRQMDARPYEDSHQYIIDFVGTWDSLCRRAGSLKWQWVNWNNFVPPSFIYHTNKFWGGIPGVTRRAFVLGAYGVERASCVLSSMIVTVM